MLDIHVLSCEEKTDKYLSLASDPREIPTTREAHPQGCSLKSKKIENFLLLNFMRKTDLQKFDFFLCFLVVFLLLGA